MWEQRQARAPTRSRRAVNMGNAGQRAALVPLAVRADQKERLFVAFFRLLPVSQCCEVKGQQVLIMRQRELIERRGHSVADGKEEA